MHAVAATQHTDPLWDWYRAVAERATAIGLDTTWDETDAYDSDDEPYMAAVLIGSADPTRSFEDADEHKGGDWVRVRLPHNDDDDPVFLLPDPDQVVVYAQLQLNSIAVTEARSHGIGL